MSERLARVQAALRQYGFDVLAVAPGSNLRYLTGLDLHTKIRLTLALLPATGRPALVLPAMEQARVAAVTGDTFSYYPWHDGDGPDAALARAAADTGLAGCAIGVEHTVMRVFELRALEAAAPGARFGDAIPLFTKMRTVKDAAELAAMREAVRIVEAALRQALTQVRAGMSEREVAAIWEGEMRAAGCLPSFDTTVASGPHGASPHHANGDRPLQDGDLVVFDGGVIYQGYVSDITRTFAVGHPSEEARRVYDLVLQANAAGRAATALPGATGASIDAAARQVIEAGGYGPYFIHRTGHGIGLDIHEPPFIVAGNDEPLPVGATFTVEPGIYLPGVCGVRIEDDLVITPAGAESMTTFPRELLEIGRSA